MFIKGMIKDCYLAKLPKITDNTYNVSITGDTDNLILYTVDGTDPIINGKVYNAPFKVDKDCIVEARAVNEWSYSSSAFADVKKSKTEIKLLTTRYQDLRMRGQTNFVFESPLALQNGKGQTPGIHDEWTMFLAISHCISLNANIYDATYTTASGNTEGFKISVKNGDLYFDVYREGVIDESIVLSEGFGVESNFNITTPVTIQYLIINSKGQINGEQKFKPIVANGEPTIPHSGFALTGEDNLNLGFADFCIYSGIKEDLEGFYITEENVGKVEMFIDDEHTGVQMRARGNIYFMTSDSSILHNDYVPVNSTSTLYTANELIDGNNWTDNLTIRDYIATAYCGDGSTPVINSTTLKILPPAKCIKKNLNSSNLTGDLNVYTFNNGGTLFLFYHNFVPTEYNQKVSLCKVLNGNNELQTEFVLIPGVGFKLGEELFQEYDSVEPMDFVIAIGSKYIVVSRDGFTTTSGSSIPINAIIQVNAPTVPLASDWSITDIVVSDGFTPINISKDLIDYLPYEES